MFTSWITDVLLRTNFKETSSSLVAGDDCVYVNINLPYLSKKALLYRSQYRDHRNPQTVVSKVSYCDFQGQLYCNIYIYIPTRYTM